MIYLISHDMSSKELAFIIPNNCLMHLFLSHLTSDKECNLLYIVD